MVSRGFYDGLIRDPQIAETEGFEPSYRDEPINAFRVRRVTAASLRLRIANHDIIHEKTENVNIELRIRRLFREY